MKSYHLDIQVRHMQIDPVRTKDSTSYDRSHIRRPGTGFYQNEWDDPVLQDISPSIVVVSMLGRGMGVYTLSM